MLNKTYIYNAFILLFITQKVYPIISIATLSKNITAQGDIKELFESNIPILSKYFTRINNESVLYLTSKFNEAIVINGQYIRCNGMKVINSCECSFSPNNKPHPIQACFAAALQLISSLNFMLSRSQLKFYDTTRKQIESTVNYKNTILIKVLGLN